MAILTISLYLYLVRSTPILLPILSLIGLFFFVNSFRQEIQPVLGDSTTNRKQNRPLIRGVSYNPIAINTTTLDTSAIEHDLPNIISLGANTISIYNAGEFEWKNQSNITINLSFYQNLSQFADQHNLNIIIGYFSNQTVDWTDQHRRAIMSDQYQRLVQNSKDKPSTWAYSLGNEIFEKLPDDTSRQAYATWIGEMVDWTHNLDPKIKVSYADNHSLTALPWLKQYAPNIDLYLVNSYEWTSSKELNSLLHSISSRWPKPDIDILLHEWGVSSYDPDISIENLTAQAKRIKKLAGIIEQVGKKNPQFIGSIYYEYSDQWDKEGQLDQQEPIPAVWRCTTCFSHKLAYEEYWGLTSNVTTNQAANRFFKPAFYTLQNSWKK